MRTEPEGNIPKEKPCPLKGFDGNRWTPLHAAASTRNFELVKLLIAKGADVNAVYRKKWTPMDAASGRWPKYEGWLTRPVRTPKPPVKPRLSLDARRRELRKKKREVKKKKREMKELLSELGGRMYRDLDGEQNLAPGP